jgi:DNA-nicking Smr family endonuclease
MGKRGQTPDNDAELWARIAKSAKPLGKRTATPTLEPARPAPRPSVKEAQLPRQPAPKAPPKPAPVAQSEALDRQTARRLERGRLAVDARLDLHGMRQRDAHAALRRFLKVAQGKGFRHVLVITGKGAEPGAAKSFYAENERGVLRQAVPHWLAAPDLASLVVSYSAAPRLLGGEGALYVRLRKGR